jgi:hypothetical protein
MRIKAHPGDRQEAIVVPFAVRLLKAADRAVLR